MNVNYYNPYVRAELELYHHGVAGQRWGKRNGPPYPLGASQVSAAEKKAGWKKSKFADGKSSVSTKGKAKKNSVSSNPVSKMKNAVKKKIDSITPEQKAKMKKYAKRALIVAGAVAVTALAAYTGYKLNDFNVSMSKKLRDDMIHNMVTTSKARADQKRAWDNHAYFLNESFKNPGRNTEGWIKQTQKYWEEATDSKHAAERALAASQKRYRKYTTGSNLTKLRRQVFG